MVWSKLVCLVVWIFWIWWLNWNVELNDSGSLLLIKWSINKVVGIHINPSVLKYMTVWITGLYGCLTILFILARLVSRRTNADGLVQNKVFLDCHMVNSVLLDLFKKWLVIFYYLHGIKVFFMLMFHQYRCQDI